MLEPGKYGELATRIMVETDADAMILMVFGGKHGNGLSIQCKPARINLDARLPAILRKVAELIEKEHARDGAKH